MALHRSSQEKYKLKTNGITEQPVFDKELELTTLSCICYGNNSKILMLEEDDFYSIDTKALFIAIRDYYKNNSIINLPSIYSMDKDTVKLEGREYVITAGVDFNIKSLKEITNRRKLQDLAYQTTVKTSENLNAAEIKTWLLKEVENISNIDVKDLTTNTVDEQFAKFIDSPNPPSIKSGFNKFDSVTGGFMKGTMTIIAAAQGIGKTTLAVSLLNNICSKGKRILFVALEMNFMNLHGKMIENLSGVSTFDMMFKKESLSDDDWTKITDARADISEYKIYRLGERNINTDDIRAKLKTAQVDMVIIDYMQLIKSLTAGSIYEIATNISRELKVLSTEFNIPFIVIASINRDYSDRGDYTPRISDIRHSGQIEYDADMVILLHRNSAYREYDNSKDGDEFLFKHIVNLTVAKNRFGESNIEIDFYFDGAKSIFKELDNYEPK